MSVMKKVLWASIHQILPVQKEEAEGNRQPAGNDKDLRGED